MAKAACKANLLRAALSGDVAHDGDMPLAGVNDVKRLVAQYCNEIPNSPPPKEIWARLSDDDVERVRQGLPDERRALRYFIQLSADIGMAHLTVVRA